MPVKIRVDNNTCLYVLHSRTGVVRHQKDIKGSRDGGHTNQASSEKKKGLGLSLPSSRYQKPANDKNTMLEKHCKKLNLTQVMILREA